MWLNLVLAFGTVGDLVYGRTDHTLESEAKGSEVVDAVVSKIQVTCIFDNDRLFLRRLARVESNDGRYRRTFRPGYHGGIWQVGEASFNDTQNPTSNSKLPDLYRAIEEEFRIKWQIVSWSDLRKPLYSGLAARLKLVVLDRVIPWSVDAQANLWKNYYTENRKTRVQDFKNAVARYEKVCNAPKADIVFVLDESGSIGSSNYVKVKNFVNSVVDAFDVASDKVRIGLITYATVSRIQFNLTTFNDKDSVKDAVNNIDYAAGWTNTSLGLDDLRQMMSAYGRNSEAAPRVGIVLTDGQSQNSTQTNSSAQLVKDDGITVFAVGVTSDINQAELVAIASEPTCLHKFELATFDDVTHFTKQIMRRSCKAPAQIEANASFSGTLKTSQYQYFTTSFGYAPGLTFTLNMISGSANLFASYTIPNPSEALNDYMLDVDSAHPNGRSIFIPKPKSVRTRRSVTPRSVTPKLFLALVGTGDGVPNTFGLTSEESSGVSPPKEGTAVPPLDTSTVVPPSEENSGVDVIYSGTALMSGLLAMWLF